ncbi:MAG TPA: flagellar basal body P-ring formation chaperone FlgA [Noviherbaspirillum sp.]
MRLFLLYLQALCACAAFHASAAISDVTEIHIELKDEVAVGGKFVTLSDVAIVKAGSPQHEKALREVRVGSAPMVGYIEQLTRADLKQAIYTSSHAGFERIEWSGARAVQVRRASQVLPSAVLVDAAKSYLQSIVASRFDKFELEQAASIADIEAPVGVASFKVRPLEGRAISARTPVWVDIYVDGDMARSVVIPMHVTASSTVFIAKHGLAAGSEVIATDFEPVTRDIVGIRPAPATAKDLAQPRRLRKMLAAGKTLMRECLLATGAVYRGDVVALRLSEGNVAIETIATAEHDARIGELIAVKPATGTDKVMGRLVAEGVVEANGTK